MKHFLTHIVAFILLAIPTVDIAATAPYYFKNIGINDGLPSSTVECIIQDKQGFIWLGSACGLSRYDGQETQVFDTSNSGMANTYIKSLVEDENGTIWIGTENGAYAYYPDKDEIMPLDKCDQRRQTITNTVVKIIPEGKNIYIAADYLGLFRYDTETEKLQRVIDIEGTSHTSAATKMHNISHLWFDGNQAYVSLFRDNLYITDRTFRKLTPFTDNNGNEIFKNHTIMAQASRGGYRYIGSSEGLTKVDPKTRKTEKLLSAFVRDCEQKGDELWVATESGVYILDEADNIAHHLTTKNNISPFALSDNAVYVICGDNEGGMWIGTYFGGVNYCMPDDMRLDMYSNELYPGFGRRVRPFCKSNDGTIWIGTEDCGLFNFNPHTKEIKPFRHPKLTSNVQGLCIDGDTLWAGMFEGGLNRIDLRTGDLKNYNSTDSHGNKEGQLLAKSVEVITKLKSGTIIIGTILGIMRYDRQNDRFDPISNFPDYNISAIHEASDGSLWISTNANGIFHYNLDNGIWQNYRHIPDDNTSLPGNSVINIFEDSRHRLWFLTKGNGFCMLHPTSHRFTTYNITSVAPGNTAYAITEDTTGMLWLSTTHGLIRFDPETGNITPHNCQDDMLTTQFNYSSVLNDSDGTIYFGSINGFVSFNPQKTNLGTKQLPIFITRLEINGKTTRPGDPHSPLQKGIMQTDRIVLDANQNSLAFNTSALSFSTGRNRDIRYRLEGLETDWHKVYNGRIGFTHLSPGDYTLHIRDFNSPDFSSDRTLKIKIKPPFYLSAWAYIIYFIAAATLIFMSFRLFKKRMERRQKQIIENIALEKERELNAAKITFFTNVTHEIRNPLTLIKGPLENILESKELPQNMRTDLEVMDMNAGRLLDLVNQLLDFHSVDTDNARKTVFHKENIGTLLKGVFTCFSTLAAQRKLDYAVIRDDEVVCGVDKEAIVKLISNLIANAIKYTATYIHISLIKGESEFRLIIDNDGDLIPQHMRESIFQPFVRLDSHSGVPGTGIGLPLARRLAAIHSGSLEIDTQAGCNRFIVTIPLNLPTQECSEIAFDTKSAAPACESDTASDTQNETVLIVEDKDDVRAFIAGCLRQVCNVIEASDGAEALSILNDSESSVQVSAIVSDVSMPHIDGLELTRRVKSDPDLNHIPVLLLTAQTDLQSNIDGINAGADAYVPKPFSPTLLRTMVTNMLESRRRLKKAFAGNPELAEVEAEANPSDQLFIRQLNEAVNQNLDDETFDLDALSSLMNMSRSSLNRKIKYYTDMTPNDYIRFYRLTKAAELLKSRQYRVNEVCFMVGFKTPSYFAKLFLKQFGISPSAYK